MGSEFGQWNEWNHDVSLDWHLLEHGPHAGIQRWVADLNNLHRTEPALHEFDCNPAGFEWIDCHDADSSTFSFLRKGRSQEECILVVCNATPVPRPDFQVGVPHGGRWKELLNSDAQDYGGSGQGNLGGVEAMEVPSHGRPWSVRLNLPPLGVVFFKRQ